ncbi:MAG: hypothetical protein ACYDCB_09245, partial [Candidatus Dormibacteria bacterium]
LESATLAAVLAPRLGRFDAASGTSLGVSLRTQAGGDVAVPALDDPLSASMATLARDVYPAALCAWREDQVGTDSVAAATTAAVVSHPERDRFEAALLADPVLGHLFPGDLPAPVDSFETISYEIQSSFGYATRMQLVSIAPGVIRTAWWECAARGDIGQAAFFVAALGTITRLRCLVSGRSCSVPVVVGVEGASIRNDLGGPASIRLRWGRLGPTNEAVDRLVEPDPSKSAHPGPSGLLIAAISTKWRIIFEPRVVPSPLWTHSAVLLEERLRHVQLAVALGCAAGRFAVLRPVWVALLEPANVGVASLASGLGRQLGHRDLTAEDSDSIAEFSRLIEKGWRPSLRIATNRLIRAATERDDPVDSLIDAVIGLESLFGRSASELSQRVSMATARLLAPDQEAGVALYRRIRDLYQKRSGVVHGTLDLKDREAAALAQEAIELLARSLREIFSVRPDLIADKERGERLALSDWRTG